MKQAFDCLVSLLALAAFWPLFLAVALAVRIRLGPGVFFRQERPGLHGRPFTMLKFRTMSQECDGEGCLLPDCDRLLPFGRFLRSSSLDELPELINVLKGEMSLVGPRPLLMQYLERYTPEQARRMEVKPGITGWAQVQGRNALSWEEKFSLDVWYVENASFMLDLKILLLTVVTVFSGKGVCQEGEVTAAEFMGSREQGENEVGNRFEIK
ncbi:MAG: sugar transferase [Proteobacteria bacterium]|nr:sugar transferase [Pseudomonadota bacterium]MBU1611219.1 sugar transferase [Pseudomonadota bacterium]